MAQNFNPILGRRVRVIALEDGSLPAAEATGVVGTTGGFVSASLSADVEDGTEIVTRKADGSLCVNERLASTFKRFTLEMEFCGVHPDMLSVMTNAESYEGYATGTSIGIVVAEGELTKQFSFELWTGLAGSLADKKAGGYLLLPLVQGGTIGDVTIDGETAVNFTVTGAFTVGGNNWGTGPFNVLNDEQDAPAALPTALDPLDHFLLVRTNVAAPAEVDGLGDMPAAA